MRGHVAIKCPNEANDDDDDPGKKVQRRDDEDEMSMVPNKPKHETWAHV